MHLKVKTLKAQKKFKKASLFEDWGFFKHTVLSGALKKVPFLPSENKYSMF